MNDELGPVCKSTRYGPGCGHPTNAHTGAGDCCCCNGLHNDPTHVASCPRCEPIERAYLDRVWGGRPRGIHPLTGRPL